MNYFTKEELQCILISHKMALNNVNVPYVYENTLIKKIELMLENYCEHESCHIDYDWQPMRCKKCLEIVE